MDGIALSIQPFCIVNLSTLPTLLEIKDNDTGNDAPLRHRPLLDERLMRLIRGRVVIQILTRREFNDEPNLHVVVERFLGDLTTAFDALSGSADAGVSVWREWG